MLPNRFLSSLSLLSLANYLVSFVHALLRLPTTKNVCHLPSSILQSESNLANPSHHASAGYRLFRRFQGLYSRLRKRVSVCDGPT
ncbi:hypothetical protein DFH05DRAFT_588850 [Lentinula detonsa]|uniref:Secreted protein n=1 Tax=Lentinula detonsa TaxID=2804962 RepID=A0A9W8P7S5_9AGAR|nr:hypothetical protein DFH05DRAFT_588850 [Lentinula detonsa]